MWNITSSTNRGKLSRLQKYFVLLSISVELSGELLFSLLLFPIPLFRRPGQSKGLLVRFPDLSCSTASFAHLKGKPKTSQFGPVNVLCLEIVLHSALPPPLLLPPPKFSPNSDFFLKGGFRHISHSGLNVDPYARRRYFPQPGDFFVVVVFVQMRNKDSFCQIDFLTLQCVFLLSTGLFY